MPFPPGGPTDHLARSFAEAVAPHLTTPLVVENIVGEAGNVAARAVAAADPDGTVLLFGTSGSLAINPLVYENAGYDPLTSFDPVIFIGLVPNVLLVRSDRSITNVAELIESEADESTALSFGSPGHGSSAHLSGVIFNTVTGTDIQHVAFPGTGPALVALAAGEIDMTFTDALTALPYIAAGTLTALAVTTPARAESLPDVPTLAEVGYDEYAVSGLFGVVAPAGTSTDVLESLNVAFADALLDPTMVEDLKARGLIPNDDGRREKLTEFLTEEIAGWSRIVEAINLEKQ